MMNFSKFRWPYRDDLAFSLLSFLVLFLPLAFSLKTYESFETIKYCLLLILLGACLVVFISKKYKHGFIQLSIPRPAFWLLIVFLSFGLLAAVLSPGIYGNFLGLYTRYTNGFLFYFIFCLFLFLLSAVLDEGKYEFLLRLVILDALLVAIYGLLESIGIGIYHGINAGPVVRSPSFLGNPNFSAFFLAAVLPLLLSFFIQPQSVKSKTYYGLSLFFIIWAIIIFTSRGALLASLFGLLAFAGFLLFNPKHRRYAALVLSVLALAGLLFFIFVPFSRPLALSEAVELSDNSINLRLYVWDVAFQAIKHYPVLGVGQGNFLEFYEQTRGKHLADQLEAFDDPHNLFLFQTATGGLIFSLSFLGFIIFVCWKLAKKYSVSGDITFAGICSSLIAWLVAASFTPVPVACFLLLAVLLAGLTFTARSPITIKMSKGILLGFGAIGAGILAYGVLFLTSEHLFFQAHSAYYKRQYTKAQNFSKWAQYVCPCNQLYGLYNLASRIKLLKDSPEILSELKIFAGTQQIRPRLRAANLYFLLFLETRKNIYANMAIKILTEILDKNPNHAERFARLGFYYYETGNFTKASENINRSLTLNLNFFPAWLLKAKLHQISGEKQPMINALKQVRKQFPEDQYLKKLIFDANQVSDIKILPIVVAANYDRIE
ncbi:MAG: O-antigen ligase family protein [Candidatus Doudnabacteria bacterium]|nr:O-antigen ligase family protein [Candidatus Doudnabacteria bacterium]